MPLIESNYRPNRIWWRSRHINTITPALLRSVKGVVYQREVLELEDGDFLDLDWLKSDQPSKKLVFVCHGLEGAADRPYVKGACKYFHARGWDALALNHRTCGGRMNRLPRAYHMGVTDDLQSAILHAVKQGYEKITMVGYSMGGNQILKYLGEYGDDIPYEVKSGVVFSVPCHLRSANVEIDKLHNRAYLLRFLQTLVQKLGEKRKSWPDIIAPALPIPRNFREFDDRYTAPLHGFANALDYWDKSSALQFIPHINRPCLLVNAQDDTFLSKECFPYDMAEEMDNFFLETPRYGGHVGFSGPIGEDAYWPDQRAYEFATAF